MKSPKRAERSAPLPRRDHERPHGPGLGVRPDEPSKKSDPYNPIVSVTSEPSPQSGEDHRSSGNFSTETSSEPDNIQFFITGNANKDDIHFDVKEDVSAWPDNDIWSGLKNGDVKGYKSSRSFYIANPKSAGGEDFIVEVWPYEAKAILRD